MILRRRFVIVSLVSLVCTVVVTNIYFVSYVPADFESSHNMKETVEQRWERQGLLLSEENLRQALLAGHRNASEWARVAILESVKELHPTYSKPDPAGSTEVNARVNAKLSPTDTLYVTQGNIDKAWSLASFWSNQFNHTSTVSIVTSVLNSILIEEADISKRGTQLKLMLTLEGNQQALFKPQWYNRGDIIDGPVYSGRDRHNAEVAAFYLALILDMQRVPYAVGRRVDLRREIMPVANRGLLETFVHNATHTCFYGNCPTCRPSDMVCGGKHSDSSKNEGDLLEGALILMLPPPLTLKKYRHPWQRTYNNYSARWEVQVNYCNRVKQSKLYSSSETRLLDLVDTSIFDFLMDNGDRHHYETIKDDNYEVIVMLDNGKGFGNPQRDHIDILAPLYQCCMLRKGTYRTLLALKGSELSRIFRKAQQGSHIFPLLTEDHLKAMDRRLMLIFAAIQLCFKNHGKSNVIIK